MYKLLTHNSLLGRQRETVADPSIRLGGHIMWRINRYFANGPI